MAANAGFTGEAAVVAGEASSTEVAVDGDTDGTATEGAAGVMEVDVSTAQVTVDVDAGVTTEGAVAVEEDDSSAPDSMVDEDTDGVVTDFGGGGCEGTMAGGVVDEGEVTIRDLLMGF